MRKSLPRCALSKAHDRPDPADRLLIDTLQRRLAGTLTGLAPALSCWAEGDFAQAIALGKTNRELHDIQESLNRLRQYLVELVGTIRHNAEQVPAAATPWPA